MIRDHDIDTLEDNLSGAMSDLFLRTVDE